MISESEMIERVMRSTHYMALWPEHGQVLSFKSMLKIIHPDKCKHLLAQEATNRLLELHRHFSQGSTFTDDAGEFVTNGHWIHYLGDAAAVAQARQNQQMVAKASGEHLRRYMPYIWDSGQRIVLDRRMIPLLDLTLPQEHVNWVVSRLLEFCMMLHRNFAYVHLGLTPAQVMLVPETHGIAVAGFYHMTPLHGRVSTISGAWQHWYPGSMLREKRATEHADLEMVKRIGAYLLGDRSGMGTSLIRTHHREFIDFLLSSDDDSLACYEKYRELIDKNFSSQFIHLNI